MTFVQQNGKGLVHCKAPGDGVALGEAGRSASTETNWDGHKCVTSV